MRLASLCPVTVQVFAEIRTFAPVEKVTHPVVHVNIEDSFRIQHVMAI